MILAAATDHGTQVLLSLFIMLAAAKLFAELFERLRQPAVVGEILAGVVIGPSVLGWVSPSDITTVLAEIGVIFLLFAVGLEIKPAAIFRVGKTALIVAVLGVAVPLLAGWALIRARGGSQVEALFVGTALVATSVGITARVLSALGVLEAPSSRIILGAAVIDDILGLLVLAVVSSIAAGQINYLEIATTSGLALTFTGFLAFIGAPMLSRLSPLVERLRVGHALFVTSLILCLGLSLAAAYIGIAAIIGAFLAGMALAEATESNHTLHHQTSGITELFVPFFLTSIGMQLKLDVFSDPKTLTLALLVTATALLTKVVGCGAGAWGLGWRQAAQVGVGMMPRGEVGIVVAQIGLSLGVIGDALFGVVLFMAVVTTLVAPPLLNVLFASQIPRSDDAELSRIA
jgi:Kef-type K+ transport system membrane component KefB